MHVARILAGTDLGSAGDDELRRMRLRVVDGLRVEQATRRRAGAWEPGPARLHVVPTVGVQTSVPANLLPLLWQLDGTRELGALLEDRPVGLREEGLAVVRRLVELGFAEPAVD